MNKKKRTSYLLLAVVAIYATIAVRFFLLKGDGSDQHTQEFQVGDFNPINYAVENTFSIKNDFRDPFLGTPPKTRTNQTATNTVPPQTTPEIPFPNVEYIGVIADVGSSRRILSVRINGKEYVASLGTTIEGVRIVSANDQEIMVSFEDRKQTIKLAGS